jgi:hypothetical protein
MTHLSRPPALARHTVLLLALALAACAPTAKRAVDALPDQASPTTRQLAMAKDMIDGLDPVVMPPAAYNPAPAPLIGRGFAQVAQQPGQSLNQRRLLAMRAARLDALRDLTEQVHGIRLTSDSVLRDAVMRDDLLAARVEGTLRGARTLSIDPRGDDGYAVTLQLDVDTLAYVLRAVGRGR